MLPYYFIEDVYMTGFVAEKCSIPRLGVEGFHPEQLKATQVRPNDIQLHYITPTEKHKIHIMVLSYLFFL